MASSTVTLEKTTTICSGDGAVAADAAVETAATLKSPLLEEKKCDDGARGGVKRCCERQYELVGYDALPAFLKHNEFILDYYRSEWPIKQALLSAFAVHNETINVWTHLIGFFMFLAFTVCAATMVPMESGVSASMATSKTQANNTGSRMVVMTMGYGSNGAAVAVRALRNVSVESELIAVASLSAGSQVARWPFYAYLCGAMFCLLMSSACHLLACHSEHASYVLLRLDYAGITGLIVTSFYPLVYYTFLCDPFFRTLYLGFITLFGAAAVAVSLMPVFEAPELRWARAALFTCIGTSGLVPIVHKMLVFGARPEAVLTTGYEMAMGAFYLAGVVVYATRVPERWMPGKFDLAGHSHQLFHVLVMAGAYAHYLAGLVYLSWRDVEAC
ncbi:heptahelical transmembrane protein ADIPOR3-like [Oryza brachyantha]|uniref:heptahelical transmembrane protein ADIPOR3-like n=1 Tax=Oryza brachyantha TaxID=4533 RepID=UPI001ADB4751|nr:heptahelical transmembrane protein ADIPOR3-like [Oryza brachyantha]